MAAQPSLLLICSGEARAEQKCVAFTDELYGSIFQQAVMVSDLEERARRKIDNFGQRKRLGRFLEVDQLPFQVGNPVKISIDGHQRKIML